MKRNTNKKKPFLNIYSSKHLKRLAMLSIGITMISSSILQPLIVNAVTADDLQIRLQEAPQVDIALTVGNTEVPMVTFEGDLLKALKDRGIDPNTVKFQSINTTSVSTNDVDAQTIFDQWANYPDQTGQWHFNPSLGALGTTQNVNWTGFWNPNAVDEYNYNFKFKAGVFPNNDGDNIGWTFRMKETGTDTYSFYAFVWNGGGKKGHDNGYTLSGLYKAIDKPYKNNNAYNPLPKGTKSLVEIPWDANWEGDKWNDIEIDVKGNRIQIWIDGVQYVDYIDEENPILYGGYGPYSFSQRGAYYKDLTVNSEIATNFLDVIRSPEWRDDSQKFIVNLDNNHIPALDDPQESGEVTMRLINDEVDYIGVGSDLNQSQFDKLVKQINNEGTVISSEKNYQAIIDETADYIEKELNELKQSSNNSQYVIVGEDWDMSVTPESYQKNTANSVYPNGRWRLDHNENYYHNGLGRYANSGLYQSDLDFKLTQPGRYELWFEDIHPSPRYIYAHRRPVANFSLDVKETSSNFQINAEDLSYDLDLQHQTDNGIAEREWKWRETTSSEWKTGIIPSNLPKSKTYIVQLRVKDHQGVWSSPESRYITTDSVATEPVANFDMPRTAFIDEKVKINDTSYDPSGEQIVSHEWIYLKNGKEVYKGDSPVYDFGKYGTGQYKVQLRVKNESGLWSVDFERTIDVLPELVGEITITPSTAGWTNGNVQLHVEGKNVSKILTPDGTYVSNPTTTYMATENGEYSFIGFNANNEVEVIMTYVVSNIDRTGKNSEVVPGDGKWKNKDINVEIKTTN